MTAASTVARRCPAVSDALPSDTSVGIDHGHIVSATRSWRRPDVPQHQVQLLSPAHGFLVWIDESALLAAARQADSILVITRQPGSFLIEVVPDPRMLAAPRNHL